jgi:hypothetical protein
MLQMILPGLYRLASLPFRFYVGILWIVLYLGATAFYGEGAAAMQGILVGYFAMWVLMMVIVQALPGKIGKQARESEPTTKALPMFLAFAIGSSLIFMLLYLLLQGIMTASTFEASLGLALAGGLLTSFVKAYIEEDVFRGQIMPVLGIVLQALLFGGLHAFILYYVGGVTDLAVLGASLAWLSGLGLLWGWMKRNFCFGACVGSHFGYNMVATGTAVLLFGAAVV